MIKDIRQRIRETVNEAIDLAIRSIEVANEGMQIHVSIPRKFQKATVVVQGAKRPFPLTKLEAVIRGLRGSWKRKHTTCDYTKVESIRHSSLVSLKMRFLTAECINPASRSKVDVLKGNRGKVLTPEDCDGAEFSILRGLGIEGEEQETEEPQQDETTEEKAEEDA